MVIEYRKLQQKGPTTLGISIPSQFIKENNLKKGDSLMIDYEGDSIIMKVIKNQ